MPTDDELLQRLGEVLAPADREPDPARVAAIRAAAERLSTESPSRHRFGAAFALAAAIVLAVGIGAVAVLQRVTEAERAGPVVEFATTLEAPDGRVTADVTGVRTGIGRVVEFRSDALPILPIGEFYEVWFVGPGDTDASPNRISAGTFHPDLRGRTDVVLTAAVDPAEYPILVVTEEPGDGDPRPSGREVLRAPIEVTG